MNEPEMLREPAPDVLRATAIGDYLTWLRRTRDLAFTGYHDLHRLVGHGPRRLLVVDLGPLRRPYAHPRTSGYSADRDDARRDGSPARPLNYAEHALRPAGAAPDDVAVLARSQTRGPDGADLRRSWPTRSPAPAPACVASASAGATGSSPTCRTSPRPLVAFLATASLGAIWAGCAPEFGARSVIDRFSQIEPNVLLAVGRIPLRREGHRPTRRGRRSSEPACPPSPHSCTYRTGPTLTDTVAWADLLADDPGRPRRSTRCPSTTRCTCCSRPVPRANPKPIVHGHGGILLEHLKNHALQLGSAPGDRLLWFTTTAWMMWNSLVSGLLVRRLHRA